MKEGWEYKKLSNVADILNGFAFKSNKYVDDGIRVIRIANVQKGRIEDNYPAFYPISEEKELTRYMLREGDLLTSLTGNVGRVGILQKEMLPAALNQRVACIRLKEKEISRDFLFYFFDSDFFEKECIASSHGAAQPNMSTVWLANYCIPIPPLAEQQRIVDLLDAEFDKIDLLKRNAEHQLQAAKDLFQSALKEMLTPKEGWDVKTLGEIGTFFRGGNFTKSDFVETGIPCVHYGQIHMHFGVSTNSPLSYLPKDFPKIKYAKHGDLLIAITSEDDEGSCKCTAWMGDEDVAIGGHTAVYRHELDPLFMSYFFRSPSFQRDKLEYTHGFKVVEIKPSDIAKISISFPSQEEQKKIVARLGELQNKLKQLQANYTETITLCNDLKQALLKSIFA